MDLVNQINACTDNAQLDRLKISVSELNRQSGKSLSLFERKKLYHSIQEANKAIEAADNRINVEYFRFKGEPEAPSLLKETTTRHISKPSVAQKHITQISDETASLDTLLGGGHASISTIRGSTISNHNVWPASATIQKIYNSSVTINTTGPLMARNVKDSTLVVKCHQLRLHNITNSTVYVEQHCAIVMEGCKGVRVGVQKEGKLRGVGPEGVQVFDFSWPSGEQNPNFVFIRDEGEEEQAR
ncbi:hypothetical protein FT663_02655 [Candidozyma haemuli var. vulneris]|nr:hypothetical protein FT662_03619 [[Candida] haemuloni var. vulneris]KAF3991573.1 hypothetical protein FT663_02655 [[Candida] haemuloni var. vulneris]